MKCVNILHRKKGVINLVMAVGDLQSLCDAACEMKNEAAAATAAHETVPVLMALQAVCDITRMVIHSWFRLAACSSFCVCVCVYRTHHRPSIHQLSERAEPGNREHTASREFRRQPGLPAKKNE